MPSKSTLPRKPRPDFPLFPHQNGKWAKKVLGKHEYFGFWRDDPRGQRAIEQWLEQKDDLLAGRRPSKSDGKATVRDLLNRFRQAKLSALESGDIVLSTYNDWVEVCDLIRDGLGVSRPIAGLGVEDFETFRSKLARGRGPVTLGNLVQRVRCVFKYAFEGRLVDTPVRFGPSFKRPSRRTLRRERNRRGIRLFTRDEVLLILRAAGLQMRAMVLLAVNCGFGPSDLGRLRIDAVDLKAGWVHHPRPKTGIDRNCPLWPETVAAVRRVLQERQAPGNPDAAPFLFITKYGGTWHRESGDNAISSEFAKLLTSVGLTHNGRGIYRLRHLFATVASDARDPEALRHLLGHAEDSDDMQAVYVETIADSRLVAVSNHVRAWLYPTKKSSRRAK